MIIDGWDDRLHQSIYAMLHVAPDMYLIVLSLQDMTGERGTANNLLEVSNKSMEVMGIQDAVGTIALTTDNPAIMRSFRKLFVRQYWWILDFACFLHTANTAVGEICAFPTIKKVISAANKVVTFFDSSHYWGGQLVEEAKKINITRKLKKNCESRWYAITLLANSVREHRQALQAICVRDDARRKVNGLSAVNADVIRTVLSNESFWPRLNQLLRAVKPLVDVIGACETRKTTLADCVIQLLHCAKTLRDISTESEFDDPEFITHTKNVFNKRFNLIVTPIHVLALFLHPYYRRLAVSCPETGYSFHDLAEIAMKLSQKWRWSRLQAECLIEDLKRYNACKSPFEGGADDALAWWTDLSINCTEHPLKTMAITLASIWPQSAEVERFFGRLDGVQTPDRSNLSVDTMEKLGKIKTHLVGQVKE
ncbi:hypothetical protein BT96DRAFT_860176, partial [Gymnopus androsaceus JB14]